MKGRYLFIPVAAFSSLVSAAINPEWKSIGLSSLRYAVDNSNYCLQKLAEEEPKKVFLESIIQDTESFGHLYPERARAIVEESIEACERIGWDEMNELVENTRILQHKILAALRQVYQSVEEDKYGLDDFRYIFLLFEGKFLKHYTAQKGLFGISRALSKAKELLKTDLPEACTFLRSQDFKAAFSLLKQSELLLSVIDAADEGAVEVASESIDLCHQFIYTTFLPLQEPEGVDARILESLLKVAKIYKVPLIPEPMVVSDPTIRYYSQHNVAITLTPQNQARLIELFRSVIGDLKKYATEIAGASPEDFIGPQFKTHHIFPLVGTNPAVLYEALAEEITSPSLASLKKELLILGYSHVIGSYEIVLQNISEGQPACRLDVVAAIRFWNYLHSEMPITIDQLI